MIVDYYAIVFLVRQGPLGFMSPEANHNKEQNSEFVSSIFRWFLGRFFFARRPSTVFLQFTVKTPPAQKFPNFVMESFVMESFGLNCCVCK